MKQRVFSGIQPSGVPTLGNYLGAIRNWVPLQDDHDAIYCVVDLHAITVWQDPNELAAADARDGGGADRLRPRPASAASCSCSATSTRTCSLAWIFNCVARLGWLNRMTQFKDKAGKDRENASAGLYVYPNLMAADILAYKATRVPVGDDQRQHLELANDIAQKFNHDYGAEFFPAIEPLILGVAARVMCLRDGTKKMSKSDPSDQSRINLTDDADTIALKIRRARTDPEPLPRDRGGAGRPGGGAQPRRHPRRDTGATRAACCASTAARGSACSRRCWRGAGREADADAGGDAAAAGRPGRGGRGAAPRRRRARAMADPIVAEAERLVGFLPR